MKTTVTFPETARTSLKTLILRLGEVVLSGAALAALLFLVVSASAARETSADASNSVPDGGRQATAMAVDPPCGMPDGISIDHMESAWGWHFSSSDLTVTVTPTIVSGLNGQALRLDYNLGTAKGAWVQMRRDYSSGLDISGGDHLRFYYRGTITNTLEVGMTSGEPRNYFASFWNSVTQVPWWTYATWDYRDFLLGDQQPFPDFSDVRAIYISVANKDGDVGGVGSLIIDELQYVSVAARTVPSDFEPVTVPPTVTQKAADWIAARQQPSGLLKSWQEEYQDYAWLYDQALGLIVLSETDLSKAGQLADTLHALHNPDGSWYNGYHFTTMLPVDDTRKPVGANAWLVYALMRYYWRSGNQTALQDALEGAAWLATLQRSDGSLPGEVSGTGAGTEPNLSAWWAFRAAGYRAQADRLRAYLTEQAWDSSLGCTTIRRKNMNRTRSFQCLVMLAMAVTLLGCGKPSAIPPSPSSDHTVDVTPTPIAVQPASGTQGGADTIVPIEDVAAQAAPEETPLGNADALLVRSHPSGLNTYVVPESKLTGSVFDYTDKEYLAGRTPLELVLPPGKYAVTIESDPPGDFRKTDEDVSVHSVSVVNDTRIDGTKALVYTIEKEAGRQNLVTALFWPEDQSLADFVEGLTGPAEFPPAAPDKADALEPIRTHAGVPPEEWPLLLTMLSRTGKAVWYGDETEPKLVMHYFATAPTYELAVWPDPGHLGDALPESPAAVPTPNRSASAPVPTLPAPTTQNSGTLSEADYKAACQQVAVSDLTKNAASRKGQLVKITGQILVMDFPQETSTGKTPTGIILSVKDDANTLASGLLPVYITYQGSTDSFIYDTVTAYGEVYGGYDYESPQIKKKTLPRIDAKYLEKTP